VEGHHQRQVTHSPTQGSPASPPPARPGPARADQRAASQAGAVSVAGRITVAAAIWARWRQPRWAGRDRHWGRAGWTRSEPARWREQIMRFRTYVEPAEPMRGLEVRGKMRWTPSGRWRLAGRIHRWSSRSTHSTRRSVTATAHLDRRSPWRGRTGAGRLVRRPCPAQAPARPVSAGLRAAPSGGGVLGVHCGSVFHGCGGADVMCARSHGRRGALVPTGRDTGRRSSEAMKQTFPHLADTLCTQKASVYLDGCCGLELPCDLR
jgi:hypothetical protein